MKTNIRDNFLGKDTLKSRVVEWLIGLMAPSLEKDAERVAPLLVAPISNALAARCSTERATQF